MGENNGKIFNLCPAPANRIIEMSLNERVGNVCLFNGLEYSLEPADMGLLDPLEFSERVRLYSSNAKRDWITGGEKIWKSLDKVTHLNMNGSWYQGTAENIISQCTALERCFFTYWSCADFAALLHSFSSDKLVEILGHVNGTLSTFEAVLDSLSCFGEKSGSKLQRLYLIFSERMSSTFNYDELYLYGFADIFESGATVQFLFQDEPESMCYREVLQAQGFVDAGYHYFAHNDPEYTDEHAAKGYELYQYMKIEKGGVTWLVGCRKQPRPTFKVLPIFPNDDESLIEEPKSVWPKYNVLEDAHVTTPSLVAFRPIAPTIQNVHKPVLAPKAMAMYDEDGWEVDECCYFISYSHFADVKFLAAPAWTDTKVQKITIFEDGKFEFLLDNGLYYLCHTSPPNGFINIMKASPRFILSSLFHHQNLSIPYCFEQFLAGCEAFELEGKWVHDSTGEALRRLNGVPKALILMRMCLERAGRDYDRHVFSLIFSRILDNIRPKIKRLYVDGRDAEATGIMDLIRAISDHADPFPRLEHLFFFVRTATDPLEYCLDKIVESTAKNAVITVVFCCSPDEIDLRRLGQTPKPVLVPQLFSKRNEYCFIRAMECITAEHMGRVINIVYPKSAA